MITLFLLTIPNSTYLGILAILSLIAVLGLRRDAPSEASFIGLGQLLAVGVMLWSGYGAYRTATIQPSKAMIRPKSSSQSPSNPVSDAAKLQQIELQLKKAFQQTQNTGELFSAGSKGIHNTKTNQYYRVLPEISVRREPIQLQHGGNAEGVTATFSYTVEQFQNTKALGSSTPQVWEQEFMDYPSGSYLLHESSLSLELVGGVRYAIDHALKPYLDSSNAVTIRLTGWADSVTISKPIIYKGDYGKFSDYYFLDQQLKPNHLLLDAGAPIATNEILAVTRSLGARDFLETQTDLIHFRGSKSYQHYAVAHKQQQGGAFRKVQVRLELEHKAAQPNVSNPNPNLPDNNTKCWYCWACDVIQLWKTENLGILGILLGLAVWHYKESFKDDKYKFGSYLFTIVFLVLTALSTFCFQN